MLVWLPRYTRLQAISDLIAGFTLGLTMIPQSIAYAALAGLPAQYGLYSSFLGGFVYAIFGTVREVSIGPTSLMALLTLEYTRGLTVEFIILLTCLTGCIELLMGVLDLGFLVDFISLPVTSGFTSATSVMIIVSQLQSLFGLGKIKSVNRLDHVYKFFVNLPNARVTDTCLGVTSIALLLSLRKLKDVKFSKRDAKPAIGGARLEKALWFVSVGRNALLVLGSSILAYYLHHQFNRQPFVLSGKVKSGLPRISLPKFTAKIGNETLGFFDMSAKLNSGIVVLPVVSVFANVAIAKVFACGSSIDASQEMRTLGLCNLLGSCLKAMPTCGAFTRSAVSHASGVETPFSGIYSGLMVVFALSFLTPYFYFIPKCVLAAVLISAVVFLIDVQIVWKLWRGNKRDAVATIGTFLVCVTLNVETGLVAGVIYNVVYLLYLSARPAIEIVECKANLEHKYLLIRPDVGLFYPAIDYVVNKLFDVVDEYGSPADVPPIVIDCQRFRGLDYTAIKGLDKLASDFRTRGQQLWFLNLNPRMVKSIERLGNLAGMSVLESEADLIVMLCANGNDEFIVKKNSLTEALGEQTSCRLLENRD